MKHVNDARACWEFISWWTLTAKCCYALHWSFKRTCKKGLPVDWGLEGNPTLHWHWVLPWLAALGKEQQPNYLPLLTKHTTCAPCPCCPFFFFCLFCLQYCLVCCGSKSAVFWEAILGGSSNKGYYSRHQGTKRTHGPYLYLCLTGTCLRFAHLMNFKGLHSWL